MDACLCGRRIHHHTVYHIRETVGGKTDAVCQKALHQVFRDINGGFRAVADNAYFAGVGNLAQHIAVITFKRNAVSRKKDVAVLKTYGFGRFVEIHTERSFLHLYILVAPRK